MFQPRLGPKPFSASAGSEEFSFDKVFSVPVVPGLTKSDSGKILYVLYDCMYVNGFFIFNNHHKVDF